MILEVVRADGARTWHRLGALPLTVGRGLSNDLILDDPYVDARHARIACDESGVLQIEDLGSVNGLVADQATLRGRVAVQPGAQVRVGRTVLRFRDPDESVAQALVDDAPTGRAPAPAAARPTAASAAPGARRVLPGLGRWAAVTTPGRLLLAMTAMGAVALHTWLGDATRSSASAVFGAAFVFAAAMALWAGAWAVASRIVVQRFHFPGHLAVVSAVALAALGATIVGEWVAFLFPDAAVAPVLSSAISFVLLVALVAGHLALASNMPRRRQWRTGLLVAGSAFAVGGLAALTKDDPFTDVPSFSGVLKPIAPEWVPTTTVDDFGGMMGKLKGDVDELAAEEAKRAPDVAAAGEPPGT